MGCIRAQSQSSVAAAALAQLEAANEALRLDTREQAAKLQAAYARWVGAGGAPEAPDSGCTRLLGLDEA